MNFAGNMLNLSTDNGHAAVRGNFDFYARRNASVTVPAERLDANECNYICLRHTQRPPPRFNYLVPEFYVYIVLAHHTVGNRKGRDGALMPVRLFSDHRTRREPKENRSCFRVTTTVAGSRSSMFSSASIHLSNCC